MNSRKIPRLWRAERALCTASVSCLALTTGTPGLMMPAFSGDLCDSAAKPAGVVDGDRGEHRHQGSNGIGRVQRASQASLQDDKVAALHGEMPKAPGRSLISKNVGEWSQPNEISAQNRQTFRDRLWRDFPPIDANTLPEVHQMGRGKAPVRRPAARSIASSIAQTEPFAFVPATWKKRKRSRGSPKDLRRRSIFSSPSLIPNCCVL